MTPVVVDLSHWNAVTSFDALVQAGIAGVILKATEGSTYVDPAYSGRVAQARAAGLLVGAYHYLAPGNQDRAATFFLQTAQPIPGMLLAVDHEDAGVMLDDLKVFLVTVQMRSGIRPVLYSGGLIKSQLGTGTDTILATFRLWLAEYTTGAPTWPTAVWPEWWLWQYSDTGKISGVSGNVDLNAYSGASIALEWGK
jgi:lysozyme